MQDKMTEKNYGIKKTIRFLGCPEMQNISGIMKSVQVSGDDAIINGIFPEGMPFEQRIREYDRVIDESIAKINERHRRMAEFYKK